MDKQKKYKVYIDAQPLTPPRSGVGEYLKNILKRLENNPRVYKYTFKMGLMRAFYKKPIDLDINDIKTPVVIERIIPKSVYILLAVLGIKVPLEIFFGFNDIYFFENFTTFKKIKGKSITVIHDLSYLKFPDTLSKNNRLSLNYSVKDSIKNADVIIAISNSVKSELEETFDRKDFRVIYPIIEFGENFTSHEFEEGFSDNATKYLRKHDLEKDKYIFFIGNMEPRKNISIFYRILY